MESKTSSWQNLTHMFRQDEQIKEMNKKYTNTILKIELGNRPIYAKYRGSAYDKTDNKYKHMFIQENGQDIILAQETEFEVSIPNPRRGLYNTPAGAVFVKRLPRRQFRHGLSEDCIDITHINGKLAYKDFSNQYGTFIYQILKVENQLIKTYQEAKKLANTFGSAAINREFGVALSTMTPNELYLLFEDEVIGYITDQHISLQNPAFFQEVQEAQEDWAADHNISLETPDNFLEPKKWTIPSLQKPLTATDIMWITLNPH